MAHELMSPFCPGRTLAACPSPQAGQLRQWIVFQAVAGQTRAEIEDGLLERFGDEILSSPRAQGWGLSAYLIPVGAFLVGGGFVVFVLRGLVDRRGRSDPAAGSNPAAGARRSRGAGLESDAELGRLVDEELARL